jgi:hypothetical protein
MFKASIVVAIGIALVFGIFSHVTGSLASFKVVLLACVYLALCAISKAYSLVSPEK